MTLVTGEDAAAIGLSLRVALTATVAAMPVALGLAYALARGRFVGRAALDAVVHLPLVVPPVATGFALLTLFGRQGVLGRALAAIGVILPFHWTGAALASAVMALPLMVRPIRQAIEAIDPQLEEAARSLGAGHLVRLGSITLPLAAPGLIAGAILGFARALGEFGATITFAAAIPGETLTLPTAIYQATQQPGQDARTLVLCAISAAIALAAVLACEPIVQRIGRRGRGP